MKHFVEDFMKLMNWKVAVLVLGASFGLTTLAQAEVATGYFKGEFRNVVGDSEGTAHVFVETVMAREVPVSYGLLIRASDAKAALFRIEEVDDGTQAWVRLGQMQAGLLGTNISQDAAFSAQTVDGKLVLTPSTATMIAGCLREVTVARAKGLSWVALPKQVMVFEGDGLTRVQVSERKLSGKFRLSGKMLNGNFSLTEVIPGVAALRSEVLNSESPDGRSLERDIAALVVMIFKERVIFANENNLKLIKITDGIGACLDDVTDMSQ